MSKKNPVQSLQGATLPEEGQQSDCKSLRKVTGKTADFAELAQDGVCFANGSGGQLLIGIEDGETVPPTGQRIHPSLLDRIRKRVGELTVNVQVLPELHKSETGDEFIVLTIPRSVGVASTSDGRHFVRVGDTCRPVVGDDVLRLADERPATPWGTMTSLRVPRGNTDRGKHPDRLEVVNAGRLPLGVTPSNILHASRRRNDGLARVFHDLKLMEREGSGFDLIYDRLLTSGRAAPAVTEGVDSVHVTVERRVVHPSVIRLIAEVDQQHQLTQRERIAVGMLSQSEGMSATELAAALELSDPAALRPWMGRLVEFGVVEQTGRTRATRYFVAPALLREAGLDQQTTLKRIEPHRLRALIVEDVARYPGSAASDIHRRVGAEIPSRTFRRALEELVSEGAITAEGEKRWRRYHPSIGQGGDNGR